MLKKGDILKAVHTTLRQNELFTISNQRNTKEPFIFSFFPESRTLFITFCNNNKVKTGELSTEAAHTELTKVLIENICLHIKSCYKV